MTDDKKKQRSEYNKKWYLENKEYRKEYASKRRKEDPDRTKQLNKAMYDRRKDKAQVYREETRENFAIQQIVRNYNIDRASAEEWYTKSKENCESCGVDWENSKQKFRFALDHNHTTGEIRGVLCHRCNSALGLLKEDTNKILALMEYNRKHNG